MRCKTLPAFIIIWSLVATCAVADNMNADTGAEYWPYVAWTYDINEPIFNPVAIADHTVILTEEKAYAIDRASGETKWVTNFDHSLVGVPVLVGKTLIVQSGVDRKVYAMDVDSGHIIWEDAVTSAFIDSHPVVVNNLLFISERVLTARDISTGNEVWKNEVIGDAGTNALVRCDNDIVVGTMARKGPLQLYRIKAGDGTVVWTRNLDSFYISHVYYDNKRLVISSWNRMAMLNAGNGEILWQYQVEGDQFSGSFASHQNRLFTSSWRSANKSLTLYCIDPETGKVFWRYTLPEVAGGAATGMSMERDRVYMASGKRLYCIGTAYGELLWTFELPAPATTSPVITDGNIIIGLEDKRFISITNYGWNGPLKGMWSNKKSQPATPEHIDGWIRDLASQDQATRDKARRGLMESGDEVLPALQSAANGESKELTTEAIGMAREILREKSRMADFIRRFNPLAHPRFLLDTAVSYEVYHADALALLSKLTGQDMGDDIVRWQSWWSENGSYWEWEPKLARWGVNKDAINAGVPAMLWKYLPAATASNWAKSSDEEKEHALQEALSLERREIILASEAWQKAMLPLGTWKLIPSEKREAWSSLSNETQEQLIAEAERKLSEAAARQSSDEKPAPSEPKPPVEEAPKPSAPAGNN
jgi:outer membrane protein assembly factor BamB